MNTHVKSQYASADLIGRENPHTQAVAVSWLVRDLLFKLERYSQTIPHETCVQWMIAYESYPFDTMLISLKTALNRHYPEHDSDTIESQIKQILGEYYDRKIA